MNYEHVICSYQFNQSYIIKVHVLEVFRSIIIRQPSDDLLTSSRLCIGYRTIEIKEADRIGYNGFLFPHEYSGEGRGAKAEVLCFT